MFYCPPEWHASVLHVLHVLCFHLDFKDGTGFPSQARIAEMTRHNRATVSRALSKAEEYGFIKKSWARGKKSRRYQAVIPLHVLEEMEADGYDVTTIPESMKSDLRSRTHALRPHVPVASGHTNESMNNSLTPYPTHQATSNLVQEEGAETSIPVSRSLRELSKRMGPDHCRELSDLLGKEIEFEEGAMLFALGALPLSEIKRFGQTLGVEVETIKKAEDGV